MKNPISIISDLLKNIHMEELSEISEREQARTKTQGTIGFISFIFGIISIPFFCAGFYHFLTFLFPTEIPPLHVLYGLASTILAIPTGAILVSSIIGLPIFYLLEKRKAVILDKNRKEEIIKEIEDHIDKDFVFKLLSHIDSSISLSNRTSQKILNTLKKDIEKAFLNKEKDEVINTLTSFFLNNLSDIESEIQTGIDEKQFQQEFSEYQKINKDDDLEKEMEMNSSYHQKIKQL